MYDEINAWPAEANKTNNQYPVNKKAYKYQLLTKHSLTLIIKITITLIQ